LDVAQAAASLLQIRLEEKRDVATPPVAFRGCDVEVGYPAISLVAPVVAGAASELTPELLLAGDGPCVEEPERGFEIPVADLEGAGQRLDAVVEGNPLFPNRIPHPLRELFDVASTVVHEHEVEIAARCELGTPVPTDRNQRRADLVAEQLDEPLVDEARIGPAERRALQVLVGKELLASLAKWRRGPSRRSEPG
jgi:hypothetical protein